MANTEVRREKAVLFKLAIFIAVFFTSVKLKDRLLPKTFDTRFSIFSHQHEEATGFKPFLQKQFYFDNVKEFMVLLFRVLLSSFIKDMIIAVCSPSIFDSPISERLIQKVENATLDKSWIPETDHQRRLKFEREKLKEAQRKHNTAVGSSDELTEMSDSGVDEDGHTFIYTIGHASVNRSVQIGHDAAKLSVRGIQIVQSLVENFISKCINLVVFTIRSIVCTFSSMLLLVLYGFQLVLRVIKLAYNFIEWVLMYLCSCVNDISLLAVEVIQESSLSNGEDIYVKLKESVDKIKDDIIPAVSSDSLVRTFAKETPSEASSMSDTLSMTATNQPSVESKSKNTFKFW